MSGIAWTTDHEDSDRFTMLNHSRPFFIAVFLLQIHISSLQTGMLFLVSVVINDYFLTVAALVGIYSS